MSKFMTKGLCLFLFLALGLAPGSVGAEEDLVWPVKTDLMYNDGDIATVWHQAGPEDAVQFKNTKGDLVITMGAGDIWQVARAYADRLESEGVRE